MSGKDDDIGIDISGCSPSGQILIVVGFILLLGLIFFIMKNSEEASQMRFEGICNHPRQIEDLTCFELQEAIYVCPDASEVFLEMNCSMANRTMRMTR